MKNDDDTSKIRRAAGAAALGWPAVEALTDLQALIDEAGHEHPIDLEAHRVTAQGALDKLADRLRAPEPPDDMRALLHELLDHEREAGRLMAAPLPRMAPHVEPLVRLDDGAFVRPSSVLAMSGGIDTCRLLIGGQWAEVDTLGPADEDPEHERDGSARRVAALLGIPVVEPEDAAEPTAEDIKGPPELDVDRKGCTP